MIRKSKNSIVILILFQGDSKHTWCVFKNYMISHDISTVGYAVTGALVVCHFVFPLCLVHFIFCALLRKGVSSFNDFCRL